MSNPVPSLYLCERLVRSPGAYIANITRHAPDWRRTTRAVGGYWAGDFTITTATMKKTELWAFFSDNIGRQIIEETAGIPTWEGEIAEMDLSIDGVVWRITLNQERFQNKVKVIYTDADTGQSLATAWSENTDSSDQYGESQYIDTVGSHYDSTVADALRDRRLIEFAFPGTLPSSDLVFGSGSDEPTLNVRCLGNVHGINRRYQESDIAAAAVSTQISTLVGNSEFISTGRITTNSLSVPVTCADYPQRLWDIIEDLILTGDAAGDRWCGGVYAGRLFHYEEAATAVTHYWNDGRLENKGHNPVPPSMIKPNIVVQLSASIPGALPAGGNVWTNPRNVWIEEVEFAMPDQYRLIPYGGL